MSTPNYPILEFDPTQKAIIEPVEQVSAISNIPEHCVITFFREVLDKLHEQGQAKIITTHRWADADRHIYEIKFQGQRFAAINPGVGSALACGILEEVIARGCRKFIACGGCGVLDQEINVGGLIVPTAALRDEGTSYHYLPPGREVQPGSEAVSAIKEVLSAQKIPYCLGKTWTTDAPYRETPEKVRRRRAEGCIAVEMEAAGFFAVAQFRGLEFGQILYGGDDVSGEGEWDHRDWHNQFEVRERLFWLAAEACLRL